jgi:3',5'-cyclic-AMP phosphodiesterase
MKTILYGMIALALLVTCSCNKLTQYSPYDANTEHSDVNSLNIAEIQSKLQPGDSLVFIAISDTHTDYSDLRAAVTAINEMEGISFVMVCGDVTDWGLFNEYDDYYHLISRLNIPFVTLIGNHDYLSNGKLIFNKMFGPTNYYFDIGNYRMVVFDNVVWENGNQAPDFEWFQQTLNVPEGMTSVACFHIHRFDPQLENGYADKMLGIIEKYPVSLSIFGHGHDYWEEEVNNRRYLMVPDISMRNMAKITLANKTATVQILNF